MDAVLIIDSANVICLCAHSGRNGGFVVDAEARAEYAGIKKNSVPLSTGMVQAIKEVMDRAQLLTGKRIGNVNLGVPGIYTKVMLSQSDTGEATSAELTDNEYELVYKAHIQRNTVKEANHASIMALKDYIQTIGGALSKNGIKVASIMPQTLCEGLYIIPESERAHVAIMIDVGYYVTDVCIFKGDALVYATSFHVGSAHIASDLAMVLEIDKHMAEQLRRQYAFGMAAEKGAVEYVRTENGKLQQFDRELIEQIVNARMEETCMLIGSYIHASDVALSEETKVYLTGESFAKMQGAREYLASQLGLEVEGLPIDLTDGTTGRSITALAMLENIYLKQVKYQKGLKIGKLFKGRRRMADAGI